MSRTAERATMAQIRATYKARDSWWTVLLVDPLSALLVRLVAGRAWVTPNRLTLFAFLLGLGAAGAFLTGAAGWLVAGALLYHVSFVVDCMDGKLARLTGSGSVRGGLLDFLLDRLRVVLCTVALFSGMYLRTEHPVFLYAAMAVVFLALFGYVNGAETDKARRQLGTVPPAAADEAVLADAAGPTAGLVARIRAGLHRHRIRMNLVSGIEFEMAVLVVGPLVVAVAGPVGLLWVTLVATVLVLLFELALIVRFWLVARSAERAGASEPAEAGTGSLGRDAHRSVPVQRGQVEQNGTDAAGSRLHG